MSTEISLSQRSFLSKKAYEFFEDFDAIWEATAGLDDEQYRNLLAKYYNDKESFKQFFKQLMKERIKNAKGN